MKFSTFVAVASVVFPVFVFDSLNPNFRREAAPGEVHLGSRQCVGRSAHPNSASHKRKRHDRTQRNKAIGNDNFWNSSNN